MCGDGGGDGGGEGGRGAQLCETVVENSLIALGAAAGMAVAGPGGAIVGAAAGGIVGYIAGDVGCNPPSASDNSECPY